MAAMPDTRWFTIDEARTLLPEVQGLAAEIIEVRADLAEATFGNPPTPVPVADRKAMEARLADLLDRLTGLGLQVKGWAPLLVDFPMRRGDRVILLCWLEGEAELTWYHDADCGFAGRRPLDRLG
jgi:hypothetical protein